MKCIVFVNFLTIYLLTNSLPLCLANGLSVHGSWAATEVGFISSIFTITGFFWPPSSSSDPPLEENFSRLLHAIDQIQISDKLYNIEKEISGIYEYVPQYTNYIRQLHIHESRINEIDTQYSISINLLKMLVNGTVLNTADENLILQEHKKHLGTGHSTLFDTASTIYNTFIKNGSSTLKYLKKTMQQHQISPCSEADTLQSNQQSFRNLITSIVVAQAKVYWTARIAATYIAEKTGDYPTESFKILSDRLKEQYVDTVELYKNLMPYTSRDVWACDPEPHVEDVTFLKLLNVFQKQIVDLANWQDTTKIYLPGKHFQTETFPTVDGKIKNTGYKIYYLDVVTNTVVSRVFPSQRLIYNGRICAGSIWDCEPLDQLLEEKIGNVFLICHSDWDGMRRFDRIEVQYLDRDFERLNNTPNILQAIGSKKICDLRSNAMTPIRNSPVCTCDETESDVPINVHSRYSYRFFSTFPVVATESGNYVVTGAKIGQYRGIIYPIIQEGRVLKNGVIDPHSLRWIDHAQDPVKRLILINPQTLEKLEWVNRTIKLGDVDLPADQVVKGLTFTRKNRNNGVVGPLRLVPLWRKFDFKTGTVDIKPNDAKHYKERFADDYGNNGTEEFDRFQSDTVENVEKLPDLNVKSNVIVTQGYLNVTTSHFRTDLGQTTVPYFDIQNVTTREPTPMSGVGLYYKYRRDAGGFIGIKLKTYDLSQHIQDPTDQLSDWAKQIILAKSSLTDGSLGVYLE